MKMHGLIRLALLAIAAVDTQNAQAGSAVAFGPHNALVTVAGLPEAEAKQRALAGVLARNMDQESRSLPRRM